MPASPRHLNLPPLNLRRVISALALSAVLCVGSSVMLGCPSATSTTPPAALAPGALNQFDQSTYQALAAAHAFATTAAANGSSLSASQKAALNNLIQALNAADVLYAAYHSGAATQAAMQTQLNAVTTAQASYASAVTGAN